MNSDYGKIPFERGKPIGEKNNTNYSEVYEKEEEEFKNSSYKPVEPVVVEPVTTKGKTFNKPIKTKVGSSGIKLDVLKPKAKLNLSFLGVKGYLFKVPIFLEGGVYALLFTTISLLHYVVSKSTYEIITTVISPLTISGLCVVLGLLLSNEVKKDYFNIKGLRSTLTEKLPSNNQTKVQIDAEEYLEYLNLLKSCDKEEVASKIASLLAFLVAYLIVGSMF
jgi:hypothetical protein